MRQQQFFDEKKMTHKETVHELKTSVEGLILLTLGISGNFTWR